jgi:molybdate transport system ATP-binding protein
MLTVKIKKNFSEFNIDLEFIVDDEILVILGSSGSGKTMTLRCIAGLICPDEGYIELNGKTLFDSKKNINLSPQKRKMGFLFQNYALFPHMTVNENVALGIQQKTRLEADKKVAWLLEKMNIPGLGHRYPSQLSSGQQQRVALARALSNEPDVLLFDEPFSALDTPRKEKLELELLSLRNFYRGDILFVTHDLAQGYKLGSRIAIFESGRIIQCDNKYKVIESPVNYTSAKLTGVKNLMKGQIESKSDGKIKVKINDLGSEFIVLVKKNINYYTNQVVTIGIRPEFLQFVDNNKAENTFLCKVIKIIEGVADLSYILEPINENVNYKGKFYLEANLSKFSDLNIIEGNSYFINLPPSQLIVIT